MIFRYSQRVGETRGRTYSFVRLAADEGSSVSSVVASSVGDVPCTITNAALATNVWSGDVTTDQAGRAMVKLVATLADGEIHVATFELAVKRNTISQVMGESSAFDIATG